MNRGIFIALIIAGLLLLFGAGYWTGRVTKKCPEIVQFHQRIDTVIECDTFHHYVLSKPVNHELIKYLPGESSVTFVHDTFMKEIQALPETFTATDTIRHDGIYVAISDEGNCTGITSRESYWGGTNRVEYITKTVTNTISNPPQVLSFIAGASGNFGRKFNPVEISPVIGLTLLEKHTLTYGYGIAHGGHTFTITTKIK